MEQIISFTLCIVDVDVDVLELVESVSLTSCCYAGVAAGLHPNQFIGETCSYFELEW